jgi:hypothetical protein
MPDQALVVYPTSAKDVGTAILFSQANSFDLAICCGGHSTGGSSSTEGGLCINMSKMRNVVVDPEKKTITAQGGALWADVDKAAGEYGLAAVGGTVNHTGIGGLTLGGGYGWLTGTHGLVIDNLLEVEYVLADGNIVKASRTENPDLFWAARGAGACFGVVTSFVYRAHEQKNPVWAGLLAFRRSALPKIIEYANELMKDTTGRHGLLLGIAFLPSEPQPLVVAMIFYNGSENEGQQFFAELLAMGPVLNDVTTMPYSSVNGMFNPLTTHGDRKTLKGSSYLVPLDPKTAESTFDDFEALVQKVPDAMQSIVLFEYLNPSQINKVPASETAFANRGAQCNIGFALRWTDANNDAVCRGWARDMAAKYHAELERQKKSRGVDRTTMEAVGHYGNYDGGSFSFFFFFLFLLLFLLLFFLFFCFDQRGALCGD